MGLKTPFEIFSSSMTSVTAAEHNIMETANLLLPRLTRKHEIKPLAKVCLFLLRFLPASWT